MRNYSLEGCLAGIERRRNAYTHAHKHTHTDIPVEAPADDNRDLDNDVDHDQQQDDNEAELWPAGRQLQFLGTNSNQGHEQRYHNRRENISASTMSPVLTYLR